MPTGFDLDLLENPVVYITPHCGKRSVSLHPKGDGEDEHSPIMGPIKASRIAVKRSHSSIGSIRSKIVYKILRRIGENNVWPISMEKERESLIRQVPLRSQFIMYFPNIKVSRTCEWFF